MATTSPDNIWYPTGTDDVGDLKGDLAQIASSVQTAINNNKPAVKSYEWANKTARDAQTGMQKGDNGVQLDNMSDWAYDGAKWLCRTPGLVKIIPVSVAGSANITIAANGDIRITNGDTVGWLSVNGLFSSDFRNYRLMFEVTARSATSDVYMRLRAAGVDRTTPYSSQRMYAYGVTSAGGSSSMGNIQNLSIGWWFIDAIGAAKAATSMDILGPALAQTTSAHGTVSAAGSSMGAATIAQFHNDAVAVDGLSFISQTGTYSLTLSVYGYN